MNIKTLRTILPSKLCSEIKRSSWLCQPIAYNAEQTLRKTHQEIMDQEIVDLIILVDDASRDKTAEIAKDPSVCEGPHT